MADKDVLEARELEDGGVPVYLPELVAHWPAVQLWRGKSGLQRLVELAGAARVEALASPAASNRACGDMQHLVLLGSTLQEFLDGSLQRQLAQHQPPGAGPLQLYLAQSPLCYAAPSSSAGSADSTSCRPAAQSQTRLEPAPLHPLMQDLGVPHLAQAVQLQSVNFWASMSATHSSLHYDPYQNLLCVVRGSKTVWLVPPSCTPCLSPQPLTHESANHSPADLAHPDLARFPALARALPRLQRFVLDPGDALFIPEGWWHQVDSAEGTLAANFWWESCVSRQLGRHMDRYYLRRLLQSLVEQQKQAALAALPRCADLQQQAAAAAAAAAMHEEGQGVFLAAAEAAGAAAAEQQNTSIAGQSDGKEGQEIGSPSLPASKLSEAALTPLAAAVAGHQAAGVGSPPPPSVDEVVATLAAQSAQALLDALLLLRRRQPQLAAHLLLHSLGPAGWELLSGCMEKRQEELAEAGSAAEAEEAVGLMCDELYSAVPDRSELLEAILACKEAFAQQALRAVLDAELAGCLPL